MRITLARSAVVAALTCAAAFPMIGAAQAATPAQSTVQAVRTLPTDDGPGWHHHGGYWGHDHYYGGGIGLGLGLGLGIGL
ncbi:MULTISPECIES: hypothetical protein [unclassified Streptomyces]|uniref:hypothetical protein n=1 Tax=unclassified Streptomyces TaxID=2593676 RepID=UPI0011B937B1|nr:MULTISPECIES: hypothetical protein [unclassified Streptomyces]MYT73783.1 hypothetical protein [Streptomyces sp. SID8367]